MNPLGALLALITLILAFGVAEKMPPHRRREPRSPVCPGALYFIRHDSPKPAWVAQKRLLCRIGAHDFYGEPSAR